MGPTLALTVAIAAGACLTWLGLVLLINHPVAVPCLALTQNQDAETLLYLSAFLVVLPLALVIGPRLADRIASGPNGSGLQALTGLLAITLALAMLGIKAVNHWARVDPAAGALGAGAIWWLGAVVGIRRATRPRSWEALAVLSRSAAPIWILAGLLTFGVVLCFTDVGALDPLVLPIGALFVAGGVAASERRWPPLARPLKVAADSVLLVLLLLSVADLIVVSPELARGNIPLSIATAVIGFHQNFLLGPANEVLAGGAMLIDTASQYGVAPIYLLAGWFTIAPIGYGTLGFLSAVANALVFAAGYAVLRIAGVPRVIAAGTFAVAVITLVFDTQYPPNAIPQNSALRFGFPMLVLLPFVAAERWPRGRTVMWSAVVLVAGLSSIWSLEAFVYSLATLAPLLALASLRQPGERRLRWLSARALQVAGACVLTHVLFAALTFAATGALPEWQQYLAYLRAFLFEPLGDLNFDFAPWSPGLLVGALHLASAAAIVLLIAREPDAVRNERTAIVALTGATAYGIAIYSYFNNRSTDFVLAGVALPAFLTAALWLNLLLRSGLVSRQVKRSGLACALSAAALLVAVGWPSIGERYPDSALGHAVPGGRSVRDALHRLWHMPPLIPASVEGQRLLDAFMPGARRSLVLTSPDLQVEILLRSGRGNALPLASPWQDSFIASERLPGLRSAIDALQGGERMLINEAARSEFATLRADASIDPLSNDCKPEALTGAPRGLAPLQSWALKKIGERFDLAPIQQGASGLAIVELVPRR